MEMLGRVVSGAGAGAGAGAGEGVVVSTVKVMELLASEPSRLLLPAASENFELATEITPSVVLLSVGVKVAVYTVLETAVQLERDPPEIVTSDSTKSVEASERVKVRVDVSPALRELSASSSVMAMVGRMVSTVKVTELLASEPSLLLLPAESENFELATEITPSVVLSAVGVKVAV